jgi:hypothetical protein
MNIPVFVSRDRPKLQKGLAIRLNEASDGINREWLRCFFRSLLEESYPLHSGNISLISWQNFQDTYNEVCSVLLLQLISVLIYLL